MGVSKWDLFKQIDQIPVEKYQKIKEFLDKLEERSSDEIILDENSKTKLEKAFNEYSKGDYFTFDQVFEDGKYDV